MHFIWHFHFRGYIETLGIPIDPPFLIFGSEPHALHKQDTLFYLRKFKEFGSKTYGCYTGPTPTIVTIDPELVKSVMIKNFDSFPAAMDVPVSIQESSQGTRWSSCISHRILKYLISGVKFGWTSLQSPISNYHHRNTSLFCRSLTQVQLWILFGAKSGRI